MIDHILPGLAALDLGATQLFAATAAAPVQAFGTFSGQLRALAQWLREQQVQAVAMEATGVYWIPVHDLLQRAGFQVTLFHGAHARATSRGARATCATANGTPCSTATACCAPASSRPSPIRQLRSFYRLREDHLEMAAAHLGQMQRALDLMNVRLHHVLAQIHGVSGRRVLDAILAGQRDPAVLAELCDGQILRTKKAEVLASLEGDWQAHHLFALRQALEAYRFYHQQIAACDAQVQALLCTLNATRPLQPPKPGQKVKIVRHNAPQIENLHGHLLTLAEGCDATLLPGISPLGWLKLTGEVGTDLRAFPSEHHFAAWAGLAPQLHQSGARHRRRPRPKTKIGQIFRAAAMSLAKSKHLALGGFYRRIKGRRGAAVAIVATARKLAILFYRAMTRGLDYVEHGLAQYEAHYRAQSERHLRKLAARLGFTLQPKTTPAL